MAYALKNQDRVTIWRLTWSHSVGVYWLGLRACGKEDAEPWLAVFREDEPGATFHAARKRPPLPDSAEKLARHVASFT